MLRAISQYLVGLTSNQKLVFKVCVDIASIALAAFGAYYLSLTNYSAATSISLVLLTVFGVSTFAIVGLYKERTLFLATSLFYALIVAALLGSALSYACLQLLGYVEFNLRVALIWAVLVSMMVGASRIAARDLLNYRHKQLAMKVAIYGGGEWGSRLSGLMASDAGHRIAVIIDDDPALHGTRINGIKVCSFDDFVASYQKWHVREVYLAMPSQKPSTRKSIILKLEPLAIKVQTVPGMDDILSGNTEIDQINEVSVDDLLGRDPVEPNTQLLNACIKDQVVMVTGAGGSIGSELCRQIVKLQPRCLVLYELTEFALYQIDQELRSMLSDSEQPVEVVSLLGNVADFQRLVDVMQRMSVDTVYHAAAYKHVPLVEHNIIEGLRNNALGTWCAAKAALQANVSTFVLVSTDKAVRPTNIMGATKRFSELMLQGLAADRAVNGHNTRFCMVRFGNVLGSSGSVVPLFRKQIAAGGPVTVTHPEITRYFMTIPEAALLVIQAGSMGQGGDVFVLDMGDEVKIVDLARRMVNLSGLEIKDDHNPNGDIEIQYSGLRPGEKLYEELLIGANVLGTDHVKIMRAEEKHLENAELGAVVDELHRVVESRDVEQAISLIRRAVEEYSPSSVNIVDWLH